MQADLVLLAMGSPAPSTDARATWRRGLSRSNVRQTSTIPPVRDKVFLRRHASRPVARVCAIREGALRHADAS